MQPPLLKNAIAFLQRKLPRATVLNNELTFTDRENGEILFKVWPMIAQDPDSGVKQRAIAIVDIGLRNTLKPIAQNAQASFSQLDKDILIGFGNAKKPKGHPIATPQMTFAPKIILYTNRMHIPFEDVMNVFGAEKIMVEIVDESELYKTLFVSYGGTDEAAASEITKFLKGKGIKTWFFPDDALPGEKLHRMMHEGVNSHDRVLLICSKGALNRPGVLNEIERVLEREANEGGADILIPVTLDGYVFDEWAPDKADVAAQVRSRVITRIDIDGGDEEQVKKQLEKLAMALSKVRG